ncbi:hypothetical protein Daus18300_013776, partial [Diaporthe australafricana]
MASGPDYVFTRDYVDNNRIWLTDLSPRLPETAQLDALDISFDAVAPKEWLPSNVTLRQWNVKSDIPADLVGRYDVIHIRNFIFVLLDAEIPRVLGNLVKLLKPGGHLQWGEPDMLSWRIETARPGVETPALAQLMNLSQPQDPRLSPKWVPRLPDLFAAAGLSIVDSDIREAPPAMALSMHECALQIHDLLAKTTKNEEVAQGLQQLLPRVQEETRQGACWAFTRWTVVGKKA